MKNFATDTSEFIYIVLHIPFENVSIAAVYSSYQQAEKYCQVYREQEDAVDPWVICVPRNTRLYNLYPQPLAQQEAIEEKISANPYFQAGAAPDVPPEGGDCDGYIFLMEANPNAPHILGVFPHHHAGGEADLYTDEYFAVYPQHVVEFWDYTIDTIYYPLLRYDHERQVFINKIDGNIWEDQSVQIYREDQGLKSLIQNYWGGSGLWWVLRRGRPGRPAPRWFRRLP